MTNHRVYVGTIGEGVWRSTDAGANFSRAADGMFVECYVRALAVDPRDPCVLYQGNETGLWRSSNAADSWERVDSLVNDRQVWSILLHPVDPDLILVGTCPSRIYRSADGGTTWMEAKTTMTQECPRILWTRVTTLQGDPNDAKVIYAGVEIDGLHVSKDGGRSFERTGTGLSSQDIHALAVVGPNALLAATNNDLNRSTDAGRTWQPLGIGAHMPWSYCRALSQPVGRPSTVYLGNGNGPPGSAGALGLSQDGGDTWRPVTLPAVANSTIWNFATHPADANLIYASSVSGQVFRSWDQGRNWEKLPREFGEIRALAWTP